MPDVRADFKQPAFLRPEDFEWVPSPGGEVERVMLDRVGDEVAVATSLVRYPAGSRFPAHQHAFGEEYLVLEGEFGDEHGPHGPGTYVRNPPGSGHTPFSEPGCVIWVKLRQFHPDDDRPVVDDVALDVPEPGEESARRQLHRFEGEAVTVFAARAESVLTLPPEEFVQEVLVIEGAVAWQDHSFEPWGWIRVPAGQGMKLRVRAPCRLLHKTRPPFALPNGSVSSARPAASAER